MEEIGFDDEIEVPINNGENKPKLTKVGQEQIHGLLFGDQLSWQAIIYDLINTEQLDPWDIDIVVLTNKYLERIHELEEANLFVSSKVLFAASLLLRIKSEIVLNRDIPSLDAILFGEREEKKYIQERIELNEEIPELVPRTPLPRFRKVTLQELMEALGKAFNTENRRIRKVATLKQQELETAIALPRRNINIKDRIREIYSKVKSIFLNRDEKLAFSELLEKHDGDKVGTFVPLLHLDYQNKVLLEQENHLDEIYIWLKSLHETKNADELRKLHEEVEKAFAEERASQGIEEEFEEKMNESEGLNKDGFVSDVEEE